MRLAVGALLFAFIAIVLGQAFALDRSLRIGTFNTYMLGKGVSLKVLISTVTEQLCQKISHSCHVETPSSCICGEHDNFPDPYVRNAGAKAMADRIIKSGFDIIALNEVWDAEVRELLASALQPTYPFFVKFIGANHVSVDDQGYNGLMLFSKLPFRPINTHYVDKFTSVSSSDSNSNYQVINQWC